MLLIVITLTILFVYFLWYRNEDKKWQHFPSAPFYPVIGHGLDFVSGDHLEVARRYAREYGDLFLVRIGPIKKVLIVTDYDLIQHVLSGNTVMKKSEEYKHLFRWLGTGLLTGYGPKWKKYRHLLTPAFHYEILKEFVDIFEKNGKILMKKLEQEMTVGKVNVCLAVSLCTLDMICESAMGTSIKAQENSESDYVKSVKEMCMIIIERAVSPYKTFDTLYYFTQDYRKEIKALNVLQTYTSEVIRNRQKVIESAQEEAKDVKKRMSFLDLLLDAQKKDPSITVDEIQEEVNTFMFAGHDTSSSAISFCIYVLSHNEEVQNKVLNEQYQVLGDDFENVHVTLQHIKDMKYLEMVVKESLRLYPPVPVYSREVEEDFELNGVLYPKGVILGMFIYELHRKPEYFEDPEEFIPERFEQPITKPYSYLPFSAGSRNCIGQKYAMIEIKSIISRLVRSFKILPCDHKLKPAAEIVLLPKTGVYVKFEKRF